MGSDRDKDSREGDLTFWLWQMIGAPASTVRSRPFPLSCSSLSSLEPNPQSHLPPWRAVGPQPLAATHPHHGEAVLRERLFSDQFSASLWLGPKVKLCCKEQTSFTKSQEKKTKWETHSFLHTEARGKKFYTVKALQNDKHLWKAISLHLKLAGRWVDLLWSRN